VQCFCYDFGVVRKPATHRPLTMVVFLFEMLQLLPAWKH
jgi:hypothetical protein